MRFGELPQEIRVKLGEQQEQQLWKEIDKLGIPEAAATTGYSCSSIYNWRSKESFLPVEFVSPFLEVDSVEFLKGGGRSKPMRRVEFPLEISSELLTRVNESVKVNREGVPVYQATELSLLERFAELLEELDVPYSTYSRSIYELRYPKYFHSILNKADYDPDFAAVVDEEGSVEDGYLRTDREEVPVEEFDGELHSREKALELALQREDDEKIREIMAEEAGKVRMHFSPGFPATRRE